MRGGASRRSSARPSEAPAGWSAPARPRLHRTRPGFPRPFSHGRNLTWLLRRKTRPLLLPRSSRENTSRRVRDPIHRLHRTFPACDGRTRVPGATFSANRAHCDQSPWPQPCVAGNSSGVKCESRISARAPGAKRRAQDRYRHDRTRDPSHTRDRLQLPLMRYANEPPDDSADAPRPRSRRSSRRHRACRMDGRDVRRSYGTGKNGGANIARHQRIDRRAAAHKS